MPADSRVTLGQRSLHQLRLFFVALQFFTRLPIPGWVGFEPAWLNHASRYFPAIGILVGLLTAGCYFLAALVWPQPVAVLLSTAFGIWITGAFHEDGFADMCDGFGGGMTAQRVFEIMKDSRIGAYGAIGIVLMLLAKCVALWSLPPQAVAPALLAAHPLSRLMSAALIWRMRYAKEEGKAKPLGQAMSGGEFAIAAVAGLAPAVLLGAVGKLPLAGLMLAALLMMAVAFWLARLFRRRIGGYTGDCLGGVQQATELACYLGLLASFGPLFAG
ncbi:cobalamin-5'-phosphate synthase [Noviherbaspirillum humi]|uniref:Adenosylcobinamide-GDP ribazoletransferase n=2 Tax=Noviherbaspirillum humi TaxID=1688639 RepID=A0A239GPQ9_9BURK|nr:adenosylcobinamide-GDP ribazoletransferase [Noviherbaspirillum humi]SNS71189.1 cobalamin-5'-phosphate synthase [Noviherbaspirillum humi]